MSLPILFQLRRLSVPIALSICLFCLMILGSAIPVRVDVVLPPGFEQELVVKALDGPTAFAIAPDGRIYIAQQSGTVRVWQDGRLVQGNFIDLSSEVNHTYNRGLVGIALHPDFPKTPFVYLAYVYQPPAANAHPAGGARLSRVLRVSANPSDLNKALPESSLVILGANGTFDQIGNPDDSFKEPLTCQNADGSAIRDCVPVEGTAHQADTMRFGPDGALYISVGDGGENPKGALRAQNVNSLSGKILRVNPLTRAGYANNPFADGDLNSNRSKVYMLGFRNPFRFAIHPKTGELYIGDVGEYGAEEIDRGQRGANFGWPCFEGSKPGTNAAPCDKVQAAPDSISYPLYAFPHTKGRVAVVGGDFYTGALFPAEYRNVYFFGDYNLGTIWTLTVNGGDVQVKDFVTGLSGLVQITTGPDGCLYVLSVRAGALYRIRWTGTG